MPEERGTRRGPRLQHVALCGRQGVYDCAVCGGLDELVALADQRLERTGRTFTPSERDRYLG